MALRDGAGEGSVLKQHRNGESPTMEEFADIYLKEHALAGKNSRPLKMDAANIRIHILPILGKKKVHSITPSDVARLHHAKRGISSVANRVLSLLFKMFSLAEKLGLRPEGTNPARHIEFYPEQIRDW